MRDFLDGIIGLRVNWYILDLSVQYAFFRLG